MPKITAANLDFTREPLAAPFGFKGGYLSELWLTAASLEDEDGRRAAGPGIQSVLWSDARVFGSSSEAGGNAMMLAVTDHALRRAVGADGGPADLLDAALPDATAYARAVTGRSDLRSTFVLNALVPMDNAALKLEAARRGTTRLLDLAPEAARPALSYRNRTVVSVPVIGYGMSVEAVAALVRDGYFVLKIKLGADPDRDGSQDAMLAADKARLLAIHDAVRDVETPGSPSGRVLYYLDANQRYDGMDRIRRFLDFAGEIGALERVIVLEEPFPEELDVDVRDLPVRVAADESAATDEDARGRMDLGYSAIALKPVAKTMSMTFRIAAAACDRGVPCFCADLTVPPDMLEWNKVLAASLPPFPGLDAGMLEANGWQNYANWSALKEARAPKSAPWSEAEGGVFHLDNAFFERSGGIFDR
jgi:hypothetical protein